MLGRLPGLDEGLQPGRPPRAPRLPRLPRFPRLPQLPRLSPRVWRPVAVVTVAAYLFAIGFAAARPGMTATGVPKDMAASRLAAAAEDGPLPQPESAFELLLRCQLPSGAIAVDLSGERIVPYFGNLAAMALVERRPSDVKEYMAWYLAHLNSPDRWGLEGTIYDYAVGRDGVEKPTLTYDSADSYAATFLTLAYTYYAKTGDGEFVYENLDALRTIASVVFQLQDTDGLVWANAARREKYLMDNAENYRGLADYARLLAAVGRRDEANAARQAADRIAQGITGRMWNEDRGNFDWAIYDLRLGGRRVAEVWRQSSWPKWYPDAVAQVFPIVYGIVSPSDPRAVSLYENLNEWHPGWVEQAKDDPRPWAILGYAAALVGDTDRAKAFVRATVQAYLAAESPYSDLSWELSWHLLTLELLRGA